MAKEGSKQVAVFGNEDKLGDDCALGSDSFWHSCAAIIDLSGKTVGCHPRITFLAKWNVTHSESH